MARWRKTRRNSYPPSPPCPPPTRKRLNLDISPDNPDLRDAHGHYLSKSEDLAEAVAEYKDNRDKTRLSKSEKKAVSAAAGVSDKRPSTSRKGGRGRLK